MGIPKQYKLLPERVGGSATRCAECNRPLCLSVHVRVLENPGSEQPKGRDFCNEQHANLFYEKQPHDPE